MAIIKVGAKKVAGVKKEIVKSGGARIIKAGGNGYSGKWHDGGRQQNRHHSQGGGQWVFVPQGGAKGSWGNNAQKAQSNKFMDKLNKIDADKKVWIGGLPKNVTWKTLEKHLEETCGTKPSITELMSKGTGCCAYKTAEDAQTAIATVNGTEIEGQVIEVDVWTQKEKKEGGNKKFGGQKRQGQAFVKKGPATKSKTSQVDAAMKVWVGGLDEKTNGGKLKKHFVDNGAAPAFADIMRKGTACVTFNTEDDAAAAIGIVNGTEIDGNVIEVDVWTQKEKKKKED